MVWRGRQIQWEHPWLGACLLMVLALLVSSLLYWPLPLHLTSWHTLSAFGEVQAWSYREVALRLSGQLPLAEPNARAGYPYLYDSRFLGWTPALLVAPLQPLLGALGAYNVALLITPVLTALATFVFLRRLTQARVAILVASSLLYTFSPFALASMANGQLEKAQLWVYPLHLWLLHRAIEDRRRADFFLLAQVTLAMTFSCPYFGFFLPLVAVPLAAHWSLASPDLRQRLPRAILALAITAVAMLPAYQYYGSETPNDMFQPARGTVREGSILIHSARLASSPVAQLEATFLGTPPAPAPPHRSNHVTYLVLPALLAALMLSRKPSNTRREGFILFAAGLLVAMGPQLVIGDQFVALAGVPIVLPARLLEILGYPLGRGGQYYRAIALASLGMAILVSGGLRRFNLRLAAPAAALLVLISVVDGLRATGATWPRPAEPFPMGLAQLRSPTPDGAVLALPFSGDAALGGQHLLAATLHERPTTGVARTLGSGQHAEVAPWLEAWSILVKQRDQVRARQFLQDLGIRYITLMPEASSRYALPPPPHPLAHAVGGPPQGLKPAPLPPSLEERFDLTQPTLVRLFGSPQVLGPIYLWDLGATTLRPRPLILSRDRGPLMRPSHPPQAGPSIARRER